MIPKLKPHKCELLAILIPLPYMWCDLGKPVGCHKMTFWEMAWNNEKASI